MVVRSQRRGLLPHDALLGHDVLLLPKAAERPIYSYRLSIVHFWSLVFIYIWAGPHHLHYTALPDWASTLGMLFSLMLWMPSWGGMINGLLTLRGAWDKVATDPILKFFVVAITFYGMATFEGPLLSIKEVNALGHYTDWIIAHVHGGALGWVGFMTFGMLYWLMPRMFQAPLWSKKLMDAHFWIATIGLMLYIVPIYMAGLTQGLMWRALSQRRSPLRIPGNGDVLMPMYWIAAMGGTLYLSGACSAASTAEDMGHPPRPVRGDGPRSAGLIAELRRAARARVAAEGPPVIDFAHDLDVWMQGWWHRRGERQPVRFMVWVVCAVVAASLFEIVPLFLIQVQHAHNRVRQALYAAGVAGPRHLHRERLLQLPFADGPPDPGGNQTLRRIQQAGRIGLRPSVPVGLAADRPGPRPGCTASRYGRLAHPPLPQSAERRKASRSCRTMPGCWNRQGRVRRHTAHGCGACGCWACPIQTKTSPAARKQRADEQRRSSRRSRNTTTPRNWPTCR